MSKRKKNDVLTGGAPEGSMAAGWAGQRGDVMRDEFGLEIPVENVPLPSRGRVYPPEHPLHMQESIQIRAMTAKEEDILTSKALIKKGTVITELIKSCLIDKRINPDEMILGDRNALMVSLRITGYGADYPVEINCPACGERSKQNFDLAALPITRLADDPIADEQNIQQIQDRKKKQGFKTDNLITMRYQHQIVAINDISDKTKIQMFCQRMPTKYSLALRKTMDNNEPGVDMKQHIQCPHCMEESEVSMPLGASFFWPDTE